MASWEGDGLPVAVIGLLYHSAVLMQGAGHSGRRRESCLTQEFW